MPCFAELKDGVVQRVIVIDEATLATGRWGDPANWVETSDDGKIRKNYAGIGYAYDAKLDAFIPPKPFKSWSLDETKAQWEAPVDYPQDGKKYGWDEKSVLWVEL